MQTPKQRRSFEDFEPKFFNHRIREYLARDALNVLPSFVFCDSVELENKELSLANIMNFRIAKGLQRMMDRLALRIEHRLLQHYPNVCFHQPLTISPVFLRPREIVLATGVSLPAAGTSAKNLPLRSS
jgi:hypothetical protein